MLALDSDVCPTPVTYTVAPLNTYTFLKKSPSGVCGGVAGDGNLARISGFAGDAGVVWGRAWMPSDVCARRSCATRSSEAEIAHVCGFVNFIP